MESLACRRPQRFLDSVTRGQERNLAIFSRKIATFGGQIFDFIFSPPIFPPKAKK